MVGLFTPLRVNTPTKQPTNQILLYDKCLQFTAMFCAKMFKALFALILTNIKK